MTDTRDTDPSALLATQAARPECPDPRRWRALILLCVANFMIILDAQIVILALPSIDKHLRMTVSDGQWVLSAYLLAFGGLLLLGGRLADVRGPRRMFMLGTTLFLMSSLLCGLAWNGDVLIAARVLQGISAAIMAPAALAILMTTFPPRRRAHQGPGLLVRGGRPRRHRRPADGRHAHRDPRLGGGVASGVNTAFFQIGDR